MGIAWSGRVYGAVKIDNAPLAVKWKNSLYSQAVYAVPKGAPNADAGQASRAELLRRQGRQAGRHPAAHRAPLAEFGNSDGDLQMLQWTCAGPGARFCLIVHHTDAEREWACDRASAIGRLDAGLDEAKAKRWAVVDMKADCGTVFPAVRQ